jgi:hypothetical protein
VGTNRHHDNQRDETQASAERHLPSMPSGPLWPLEIVVIEAIISTVNQPG